MIKLKKNLIRSAKTKILQLSHTTILPTIQEQLGIPLNRTEVDLLQGIWIAAPKLLASYSIFLFQPPTHVSGNTGKPEEKYRLFLNLTLFIVILLQYSVFFCSYICTCKSEYSCRLLVTCGFGRVQFAYLAAKQFIRKKINKSIHKFIGS